jgi:hypothetical protein
MPSPSRRQRRECKGIKQKRSILMNVKSKLKETISFWWWCAAFAVVFVSISFGRYYYYGYFASKYEAIRYNVYREGPAYNTGMVAQLRNYQIQLSSPSATADQKSVIYAAIKQQYAEFDPSKLPIDLQPLFIEAMK